MIERIIEKALAGERINEIELTDLFGVSLLVKNRPYFYGPPEQ